MKKEDILAKVEELARESAWPGCPGGWQYPHDLGNGILTPTYTDVQKVLHPFRLDMMRQALMKRFGLRLKEASILELGSCESALSFGLHEIGVRNITNVEVRELNCRKAKFVAQVKGIEGLNIINCDLWEFLAAEDRTWDIVLFMGILYHLQDHFAVLRKLRRVTGQLTLTFSFDYHTR